MKKWDLKPFYNIYSSSYLNWSYRLICFKGKLVKKKQFKGTLAFKECFSKTRKTSRIYSGEKETYVTYPKLSLKIEFHIIQRNSRSDNPELRGAKLIIVCPKC